MYIFQYFAYYQWISCPEAEALNMTGHIEPYKYFEYFDINWLISARERKKGLFPAHPKLKANSDISGIASSSFTIIALTEYHAYDLFPLFFP